MGLNYNNTVDQDLMPNQASPGPDYSAPMDGAPGPTTIHRKGVITLLRLTGNLTASRIFQFGSPVTGDNWLAGDTVFVELPAHTGTGFDVTVENIASAVLTSWPELTPNGGMFVYDGALADFIAVLPGAPGGGGGVSPYWNIIGNTIATTLIGGTLTNQDVQLKSNNVRRFTILKSGQVAVGAADPAATSAFEIQDGAGNTGFIFTLTGAVVMAVERDQAAGSTFRFINASGNAAASAGVSIEGDAAGFTWATLSSGNPGAPNAFVLNANGVAVRLLVDSVGRISIGPTGPDASAQLDIQSTTHGLLIPRMTTAQRNAIVAPATGLQVIVTDGTAGLSSWDGTAWVNIRASQAGVGTLGAGTATIAAQITANSRVLVTMKDPGAGAIPAFAALDVPVGTRVVGNPGSFIVNAIDNTKALINTAVCTFDWLVITDG